MKHPLITFFTTMFIFVLFLAPYCHKVLAADDDDDHYSEVTTHNTTSTHAKKKTVSTKKIVRSKTVKKAPIMSVAAVSALPSITAPTTSYTMTTVALHNSAASCWTTISGNVYDFTPWIAQHASNQHSVLSLCGTDSTTAFNAEYANKAKPTQQLKTFLIGKLR